MTPPGSGRPLDLVLTRLRKVKQSGSSWSALCPAHEDSNPSLSIKEGDDGRVLLKCHAGCGTEEICRALDLQQKDLFIGGGNGRSGPKQYDTVEAAVETVLRRLRCRDSAWRITQSYIYNNAEAREVMRVLRFEKPGDKTFRPLHRAGGRWREGDPKGKLLLYRLPELAEADRVYVCEGEKAVDTAVAIGLVATTSTHGSSAAKKTDWSPLAGKDVVILPDNDAPGKKYAQNVSQILTKITPPPKVKIVELPDLPDHGDVVDYIEAHDLAANESRQRIEQLAAASPGIDGCPDTDFDISYTVLGGMGKVVITITLPNGEKIVDQVVITRTSDLESCASRACKGRVDLDEQKVLQRLREVAAEVASDLEDQSDQYSSQAAQIVALTEDEGVELFHTAGDLDSDGYATISHEDRRETWPIDSEAFHRWLTREYYQRYRTVPKTQAMTEASALISARATFDGPTLEVAVRVTGHDGRVYIDLGDEQWRVVEVSRDGWKVRASSDVPVRFVRKRGMLSLPLPVPGGSIEELRPLINIPDDESFVLLVITLVTYLLPSGPYVIVVINGEQGSAKSTMCRILRLLVDPNKAPVRRLPRDERDLMIAASNSWVLMYDNLSGIPSWLSDAMCSLATGAGFATRELYTNDDEKLMVAARPIVMNGIDDLAGRADLLDRSIILQLRRITKAKRREEAELNRLLEGAAPRVLGALLDGVSAILRNQDQVVLREKPRMADYAVRGAAAAEAFGWEADDFLSAYTKSCDEAYRVAIEAAPVGGPIVSLVDAEGDWKGTAKQLLTALESHATESAKKDKGWPKTPRGMSGALKRLAPSFRALGFVVELGERDSGKQRQRLITLGREQDPQPSEPSEPSDGRMSDEASDGTEGTNRPTKSGPGAPENGDSDGTDGSDGLFRNLLDPEVTGPPEAVDRPPETALTPLEGPEAVEGWDEFLPAQKVGKQPSEPSEPSDDEEIETWTA